MNKKILILIVLFIVILSGAAFFATKKNEKTKNVTEQKVESTQPLNENLQVVKNTVQENITNPIENALSRITKKPFGIFITPKNSPVQPERFSGYHTGVDLETNPDEQNIDVPVSALCEGNLLMARFASGYGGVLVESCNLEGQDVTVVYGHINLASVKNKIGDEIKAGNFLANLGKGYSSQTDGERKHLHLAIHKGTSINILGYVQNEKELSGWLDPRKYLK